MKWIKNKVVFFSILYKSILNKVENSFISTIKAEKFSI